jgi:hypothetical protein
MFTLRSRIPAALVSDQASSFDDLPTAPLPAMDLLAPNKAIPKTLSQHRRGECLWPLGPAEVAGDWRTLFCCAQVVDGRAYCSDHARLAWRPPDPAEGGV